MEILCVAAGRGTVRPMEIAITMQAEARVTSLETDWLVDVSGCTRFLEMALAAFSFRARPDPGAPGDIKWSRRLRR
jgi:hypothetical protein